MDILEKLLCIRSLCRLSWCGTRKQGNYMPRSWHHIFVTCQLCRNKFKYTVEFLQENLKSFAFLPDSSGSFLQTYVLQSSADPGSIPVKPAKCTQKVSSLKFWGQNAATFLRALNQRKSEAISNLFRSNEEYVNQNWTARSRQLLQVWSTEL